MAEGLNKVILIGNLGQDPELRYTQSGQGVLNIRMATTSSYSNKSGERQERTEWHSVSVWGARGEALHKILSKGRSIFVEGRISYRSWEDREGNKRTSTEIVATDVLLLGGSGRSSGGGDSFDGGGSYEGQSSPRSAPPQGGAPNDFPGDDFSDDDIPF